MRKVTMFLMAAAILVAFTTPVMAGQVELWVTVCCGSGNNTGVRGYDYTNKVFNSTPEVIHKHNNEGYPRSPFSILYVPGVGTTSLGSMLGSGGGGAGSGITAPSSQGRDVATDAQNAAYQVLDQGGVLLSPGEGALAHALGRNNLLYYVDGGGDKIVRHNYDGTFAGGNPIDWVASGLGATSVRGAEFNNNKSRLYITDNGGASQLIIYNAQGGNRQTYAMSAEPDGLEFHPTTGQLYVTSRSGKQVVRLSNFDANGVPQTEELIIDSFNAATNPDGVSDPVDVAFHPQMSNTIFVSDTLYALNAYNLKTGEKRFGLDVSAMPFTFNIEFTPEPATIGLLGLGSLMLLRRQRKA